MRRALPVAAVLAAALASLATPAPRMERAFPTWELGGAPERTVGCARLTLQVGKAGKEGLGLLLIAEGAEGCEVAVVEARLQLRGAEEVSAALPASMRLVGGTRARLWLPFLFDAEERWNEGIRSAAVRLRIRAGAVEESWVLPAEHVLRELHEDRRRGRDLEGGAGGAGAAGGAGGAGVAGGAGAAEGAGAAGGTNAAGAGSEANAAGAPGPVPPEAPTP